MLTRQRLSCMRFSSAEKINVERTNTFGPNPLTTTSHRSIEYSKIETPKKQCSFTEPVDVQGGFSRVLKNRMV